eukprot:7920222-Pyramimonas_sp.AAC.1
MAIRLELRWRGDGDVTEHRMIKCPPLVVENVNASCTFEALRRACQDLSLDAINKLSEDFDAWIIIQPPAASPATVPATLLRWSVREGARLP